MVTVRDWRKGGKIADVIDGFVRDAGPGDALRVFHDGKRWRVEASVAPRLVFKGAVAHYHLPKPRAKK